MSFREKDRVRIANPKPGHSHVKGLAGTVIRVQNATRFKAAVVHVSCYGGKGKFDPEELERVQ